MKTTNVGLEKLAVIKKLMESGIEVAQHLQSEVSENPMPEQLIGTVIVFKDTVTTEQAKEILKTLKPVLEMHSGVNVFNPNNGLPVWYIP